MMRRQSLRFATVAAAAVAAAGATTSLAQQASDLCADAPLIGPGSYSGTTVGANVDGSAGCDFSSNAPDVWYRITTDRTATLLLDLCASSFDTVVSLHTGCPGVDANEVACNDQGCGNQSRLMHPVESGETYYIRISGWANQAGAWQMNVSYIEPPPPGSGPDVVYSDISDVVSYTAVGGVVAYSLGTYTCNLGAVDLMWSNGGTPGIGFNMYRLHEGRMMQLGQSWAKIACCAAASNGCGALCNGHGGSVLGAGCLDVYGAGWNGSHSNLRPRSRVNPWTGQFSGTINGPTGSVDRRLQVQTADLSPANFPGALYFVEGVYVATDEAPDRKMNNASHRRVTVSGTNLSLTGATQAGIPAIYAWREHGLGVNQPDESVVVQEADVPDEGRFVVAHTARDNGDGTWRYEYAVFNLNSHRAGGSFSVPVAPGAAVTNAGFHDVPYHSGEPYDNTDWSISVSEGSVTWSSPQSFEQNENSNALRWGTMYNFWFDADRPPAEAEATLGLFRPGTPGSLAVAVSAPAAGGTACPADWDGDESVNSNDISAFLGAWLADVQNGTTDADFDQSGSVNSNDISAFLSAWLDAVQGGC